MNDINLINLLINNITYTKCGIVTIRLQATAETYWCTTSKTRNYNYTESQNQLPGTQSILTDIKVSYTKTREKE